MSTMQFTPADYRAYIQMSHRKHLLVEGRKDKRAFKLLLDEYCIRESQSNLRREVDIDTAESLIGFISNIGNREKVEQICNSIASTSHAYKIIGFVDREFREFEISNALRDTLMGHKVSSRLVWSKGHSVENYFFDYHTLRSPLRDFSVTAYFDEALILLDNPTKWAKKIRLSELYLLHELQKPKQLFYFSCQSPLWASSKSLGRSTSETPP